MIFCHASFCFLDGVGPTACDDVDVVGCWLDRPLYVGIHLYRYDKGAITNSVNAHSPMSTAIKNPPLLDLFYTRTMIASSPSWGGMVPVNLPFSRSRNCKLDKWTSSSMSVPCKPLLSNSI
jgi:hypothetical protein